METFEQRPLPRPSSVRPLWSPLHARGLRRFSRGLLATELLHDLNSGEPFTLLAPVDAAFDGLPFCFEDLLLDPSLVEARFDIFEYLVVRGTVETLGRRRAYPTTQGECVRFSPGLALGRFGASRILDTFVTGPVSVHVLEQCLFPIFPGSYLVQNEAGQLSCSR